MDSEALASDDLIIDIERIVEMIPHRYPFLMIDRVSNLVPGESAVGLINVTINDPYFQGHGHDPQTIALMALLPR